MKFAGFRVKKGEISRRNFPFMAGVIKRPSN